MVQKLNPENLGKTIIGLTGGFGSGKSTVAHFFEELGAYVVDADKLAHEALMPGSSVYEKIRQEFKDAVIGQEGIDLKKLAGIVFRDPERKKKLEAIIHPYVFNRILEEINDSEDAAVVVEVPLLFETGYNQFCQHVVVVSAPEPLTTQRLLEKGFSEEEIVARRKAQMPLEEKQSRADIVINNSGTFQQTRRVVEEIWKRFHPASKGAR